MKKNAVTVKAGEVLKITLLVRYFTIGGLERVVISLANGLTELGWQVQIVILSRGKRNSLITELDSNVNIVFLDGNFFSKARILRQVTKNTLVHIHFGDGKIHPFIRMQLLNRMVLVTYHSVYRHKRNRILNCVDYLFNHNLPRIVAVSDSVKEFCCKDVGLDDKNIVVIKNGIKNECRKKNYVIGKKVQFVVLCSMYPHKNHREIIENFATLKKEGIQNWHLTFIGDGPSMSELFLLARRLGLGNDISWLGAVWNRELVGEVFEKMDILLSASKYEGFPISILEAMNYSMPLMLSDIPPHREIGGEDSFYFELGNYASFKASFVKIIDNKEFLFTIGQNLHERLKKFDIDLTIEKYIAVYNEIYEIKND